MEGCWDARSLEPLLVGAQQQYHHARSRRTRSRGSAAAAITLLSSEDINEQFCYLRKYCVLVCKEHATSVLNLKAHLRSYHSVASEQRRAIVQHFRGWPINPAQDVALPAALSPPIEELGQPLDGLACEQDGCSFITINVDTLRIHAKKHHNIAWKGDTSTLYKRVKVQTFFRTGGLQRYFVVRAADRRNAPAVSRDVADVVKERLAEWQLTQHAHEERAQVMDAHVAKTDKTGWFKRTGWLEHFANRNLMHLAHQIRLPDQGEVKLWRAAKLTELLVERSVKGLSTLARETRRWLRSAKRQEIDQRPMARLQNPES
jgi:hypothetical protein